MADGDWLQKILGKIPGGNAARREEELEMGKSKIEEWEKSGDVNSLINMVDSDDVQLRELSVKALGRLGDPAAAEGLLDLLAKEQGDSTRSRVVIFEAAEVLLAVKGPQGISELFDLLVDQQRPALEWQVLRALHGFRQQGAQDIYLAYLESDNPQARGWAAQLLGSFENPKIISPLIAALKDPEEEVRYQAAGSLAHIPTPESARALIEVLQSEDVPRVRAQAASSLGPSQPGLVEEPLLAGLEDTSPEVRKAAVEALAHLGDPSHLEEMIKILSEEEEYSVLVAAQRTLEKLAAKGGGGTVPLLISLVEQRDPVNLALAAARVLGEIGDPRAVSALEEVSQEDENENLRITAEIALRKVNADN